MTSPSTCRFSLRARLFGWAMLLLSAAPGCGGKPDVELPTTYLVTGVVQDSSGQPLAGGAVQFQSQEDPSTTALAEIGSDGTFSLSLYVDGNEVPGTIAGPYEVTVIPPDDGSQTAIPVTLDEPYEVTAGEENQFTIKVP